MYNLDTLRNEIDAIDLELVLLLQKRFTITNEIGIFKRDNNILVNHPGREEEIINSIKKLKLSNEEEIIHLYKALFLISKNSQEEQ